jgi:hypothetical protein
MGESCVHDAWIVEAQNMSSHVNDTPLSPTGTAFTSSTWASDTFVDSGQSLFPASPGITRNASGLSGSGRKPPPPIIMDGTSAHTHKFYTHAERERESAREGGREGGREREVE